MRIPAAVQSVRLARRAALASAAALALAAAAAIAPATLAAQERVIDEGTLNIARDGAAPAVESFKIVRFGNDSIRATGQLVATGERMNSRLVTDALGTPIDYLFRGAEADRPPELVRASARAGRLLLEADTHGRESQREFPVRSGDCVILDPAMLHQLYFVPLAPHASPVFVVRPRAVRGAAATVQSLGFEPLSIGGRSVTAQHYALGAGDGRVEFWVDSAGRLLRVSIPAVHLEARREELPL